MILRAGILIGNSSRSLFYSYRWHSRSLILFLHILFLTSLISNLSATQNIFSPVAISRGNILYNPESPLENQLYLGSALGYFQRPGFYGGYNRIIRANEFWGSIFLPRSEGVFGITYAHSVNDNSDLTHGFVQLGFGKSLTDNLSFGFFLNYSYTNLTSLSSIVGFEPSIIYSTNPATKARQALAIHNVFIYSAIRNLDLYSSVRQVLNPSLHVGMGAKFLQIKDFYAGFQLEDSIDTKLETSPFSAAFNLGYSIFQVRAGYAFGIPLKGIGNFPQGNISLGAGFQYVFSGLTLNAQYAITGFETGNYEHHMAFGVIFSYADTTPPVLQVTPDHNQFSPNDDGKQDYVTFHISAKDLSPIKQWKLTIKNARGEIVRTYEKDYRVRSIFFPVSRIVTDLFKRREYRYIPETIIWDGTSDKINSTAAPTANPPSIKLVEGTYFYEMAVIDEKGMTSNSPNGAIIIDNTYPDIILKRDSKSETIADNNAGKIFFAVTQFTSAQTDESFSGTIYNENEEVVRSYTWNGIANLPKLYTWDGMDQNNRMVKEGIYRYELRASDNAGNESIAQIHFINVSLSKNHYNIIADAPGFSPNGDNQFDKIIFSLGNKSDKFNTINNGILQGNLISWKVYLTYEKIDNLHYFNINDKRNIKNQDRKVQLVNSEIPNPQSLNYLFYWSGDKNNFLNQQSWDGKNINGKILPDGHYFLTLIVKTADGDMIKSESIRISIDTIAPEVSIRPEKMVFSPDGDDVEDYEFLSTIYHDQSEIKNYTLTLFEVLNINGTRTRIPFKTWSGKNMIPDKFYINGVSDFGLSMESLKEYEYEIEVSDIYDNSVKKTIGGFNTGVLANAFTSNLKITLTGLTYRNLITPESLYKLDQVFNVLVNDYPGYRIRIEGHTNDGGDEEANIRTSEQRARTIMRYFINKGIPYEKIGFQGYGEIQPLTDIENDVNNYKNDRIEFILIK